MKYSNFAGSLTWSGGTLLLRKGQSVEEGHPILDERPDLFTDQEPGAEVKPMRTIETHMQGPGEHRMERAPARPQVVKAPPRPGS